MTYIVRRMNLLFVLFVGCGFLAATSGAQSSDIEVGPGVTTSVTVNHQGPFRFCLDTGFGDSLAVSDELAKTIGLVASGHAEIRDPGSTKPTNVPTARLDEVSVGSLTNREITATIQRLPEAELCQGIIGLSFFKGHLLTLNLPNKKLEIGTERLKPTADGVLPYQLIGGIPNVAMKGPQSEFAADIDTMAPGLSIPLSISEKLQFDTPLRVMGMGRTVNSTFEIKGATLKDHLLLGNYDFAGSFVEVNSQFPHATLGLAALRHFEVTFDQDHRLVRFVSPEKSIVIAPPQMRMRPQPISQ